MEGVILAGGASTRFYPLTTQSSKQFLPIYIIWYDFCCGFCKQYGLKTKIIPVTTAEYGLNKAVRPRLDKRKLIDSGFTPLPMW